MYNSKSFSAQFHVQNCLPWCLEVVRVRSRSDGLELLWIFSGHPPPQISVYQSSYFIDTLNYFHMFPMHLLNLLLKRKGQNGFCIVALSEDIYFSFQLLFYRSKLWIQAHVIEPQFSAVSLFLTLSGRWGTRVKLAWMLGPQYLLFQFSLLLGVWKSKMPVVLMKLMASILNAMIEALWPRLLELSLFFLTSGSQGENV